MAELLGHYVEATSTNDFTCRSGQDGRTAGDSYRCAESASLFLRLNRLHGEIFDRLRNLFEPMRSSGRNHDHVTLRQVMRFASLNIGPQHLARPADFPANNRSAGHERRLTF